MRSSRFQLQSLARRWSGRRPSFTAMLLAGSIAAGVTHWSAFLLTGLKLFTSADPLIAFLGLSAETVHSGRAWQFLTFAFVHANPLHLLANVLPLYLAGREVEPIMGGKHFLSLYVLANLLGGLAQWGAMAAGLAPEGATFVGISAGVAAIVSAFATILPELEVTVLILFVLPLRVRAKRFGFALALLALVLCISQTGTVVGPVAILVGTLLGWLYANRLGFGNPLAIERYFIDRKQHELRLARMPAEQFIAEEIDPVLEKVARTGMGSLTRAEKRLLQRGSSKLAERASNQ
ncbi:MAG TPA: rhomboid family intramembrane serine protease [Chthoniobacteraceae bacterium]|jgi:membrane associated rhomboid family serine protease|nr:rhomboid family intramembrane serine protease [Chthoniobacteraceae bacterium]